MKEPRTIQDVLLDIAENPNDGFGNVLRQCPQIQKDLKERQRKKKQHDNDKN